MLPPEFKGQMIDIMEDELEQRNDIVIFHGTTFVAAANIIDAFFCLTNFERERKLTSRTAAATAWSITDAVAKYISTNTSYNFTGLNLLTITSKLFECMVNWGIVSKD